MAVLCTVNDCIHWNTVRMQIKFSLTKKKSLILFFIEIHIKRSSRIQL